MREFSIFIYLVFYFEFQNSDNESPLHSAAQFNHHSVVSLLLMHGADLDLRNSKDETSFDLGKCVDSFKHKKLKKNKVHYFI